MRCGGGVAWFAYHLHALQAITTLRQFTSIEPQNKAIVSLASLLHSETLLYALYILAPASRGCMLPVIWKSRTSVLLVYRDLSAEIRCYWGACCTNDCNERTERSSVRREGYRRLCSWTVLFSWLHLGVGGALPSS